MSGRNSHLLWGSFSEGTLHWTRTLRSGTYLWKTGLPGGDGAGPRAASQEVLLAGWRRLSRRTSSLRGTGWLPEQMIAKLGRVLSARAGCSGGCTRSPRTGDSQSVHRALGELG